MQVRARLVAAGVLAVALGRAWSFPPPVEQQCLDCHRGGVAPIVEGQHAEYLATQLRRFRDLHRESFPMSPLAGGLDDAATREWADALEALPWPAHATVEPPPGDPAAGRSRADALGCASCHGEGFGGAAAIPRLAGQHAAYLERQLRDFDAGRRYHPPLAGGIPMRALRRHDPRNIAAFLSGLAATGAD